MAGIKEHEYLKVCAKIASSLSISISAASKKIDIAAAKEGIKDFSSRKEMAENILKKVQSLEAKNASATARQLDSLLEALSEEENFLVED